MQPHDKVFSKSFQGFFLIINISYDLTFNARFVLISQAKIKVLSHQGKLDIGSPEHFDILSLPQLEAKSLLLSPNPGRFILNGRLYVNLHHE